MTFDNRHYVIIPSSEVNQVNFSEVLETSAETCRYSVDGSKTFVKYEGLQPPSIAALQTKSQEYTHEEILDILVTSEWTFPASEIP
jgi:hypothetical protein